MLPKITPTIDELVISKKVTQISKTFSIRFRVHLNDLHCTSTAVRSTLLAPLFSGATAEQV